MPLAQNKIVWSQEGLDAPVLVNWGKVTGERPDLVAAAGKKAFVFTASNWGYFLSATIEVGEVLSLAVGLPVLATDHIILGLEDRVLVYGNRQGVLVKFWETEPEPGARFVDLAIADLDGDGREEVIAASAGKEALYIYRLTGEIAVEMRLELLAIRILPGPAQKVVALKRNEGKTPWIVTAYKNNGSSGLLTLIFTERGFMEGPAIENLPALVTSLAVGDLRKRPGEEVAWGGGDGVIRVVEVSQQLSTLINSDNLGSTIPALTAGKLVGEISDTLIAGIPEGYLFGFQAPVEKSAPDWAVWVGRPVNDLAVSDEGMLGLGTGDGGVQVWRLSTWTGIIHIIRPGETLASIANKYKITVAAIAKVNRIANPNLIFPGRELLIP